MYLCHSIYSTLKCGFTTLADLWVSSLLSYQNNKNRMLCLLHLNSINCINCNWCNRNLTNVVTFSQFQLKEKLYGIRKRPWTILSYMPSVRWTKKHCHQNQFKKSGFNNHLPCLSGSSSAQDPFPIWLSFGVSALFYQLAYSPVMYALNPRDIIIFISSLAPLEYSGKT